VSWMPMVLEVPAPCPTQVLRGCSAEVGALMTARRMHAHCAPCWFHRPAPVAEAVLPRQLLSYSSIWHLPLPVLTL
jgi:hypothetical protein